MKAEEVIELDMSRRCGGSRYVVSMGVVGAALRPCRPNLKEAARQGWPKAAGQGLRDAPHMSR